MLFCLLSARLLISLSFPFHFQVQPIAFSELNKLMQSEKVPFVMPVLAALYPRLDTASDTRHFDGGPEDSSLFNIASYCREMEAFVTF